MRSVFLSSPEETSDIRFRLGQSKANITAYIETIFGFCFHGRQIKKFSFAKVGSCELNENYGSFLAK